MESSHHSKLWFLCPLLLAFQLTGCSTPPPQTPAQEPEVDPRVYFRDLSVVDTDDARAGAAIRRFDRNTDVLFWDHHNGPTVYREVAYVSDEANRNAGNAKSKSKDKSIYSTKGAKKDKSIYTKPQKKRKASKSTSTSQQPKSQSQPQPQVKELQPRQPANQIRETIQTQ